MGYFEAIFKGVRVNGITMVLGSDVDSAGGQFTDRMVATAVTKL